LPPDSGKGKSSSMGSSTSRIIIVTVLLLIIAVIGLYYYAGGGCDAKITQACLSTNIIKIKISSSNCKGPFTLKIIGPQRGEVAYTLYNITPGLNVREVDLPSFGNYTLQLEYHGKKVAQVRVQTLIAPSIMQSRAALMPNGTLLVNVVPYTSARSKCFSDYGVKEIIVVLFYNNGTNQTLKFTGYWKPGTIKIPLNISPENVRVAYVYVTDTLNNRVEAAVLVPH